MEPPILRRMRVAVLASTLALSLPIILGPFGTASADDGVAQAKRQLRDFLPELSTPDDVAARPLARGRITHAKSKGSPAAGALVTLQVWPNPVDFAKIPIGGTVPVATVAKSVTDAKGAYELKLDDPSLLTPYLDGTGSVDVEVVVESIEGRMTTRAATIAVVRTSRGVEPADAGAALVADLAAEDVTSPAKAIVKRGDRPRGGPYRYYWKKVSSLGVRDMLIEHIASTVSEVKVQVTNKKGTSSELGIGSSLSSANAGFKLVGTTTVTSDIDTKYGAENLVNGTSTRYFRDVEYELVRLYEQTSTTTTALKHWQARPSGYVGGYFRTYKNTIPSTPTANCTRLGRDGEMSLKTSEATTFSAGVEISKKIGIYLSSRSGRSASQAVTFTNTSTTTDRKVCGVKNLPGKANSGVLVARPA